jgi:hypothetical protein
VGVGAKWGRKPRAVTGIRLAGERAGGPHVQLAPQELCGPGRGRTGAFAAAIGSRRGRQAAARPANAQGGGRTALTGRQMCRPRRRATAQAPHSCPCSTQGQVMRIGLGRGVGRGRWLGFSGMEQHVGGPAGRRPWCWHAADARACHADAWRPRAGVRGARRMGPHLPTCSRCRRCTPQSPGPAMTGTACRRRAPSRRGSRAWGLSPPPPGAQL